MSLSVTQLDLLREFETGLDPRHPAQSRIPARVLGYGEISTVLALPVPEMAGLAFKRLPLFASWDEVERYQTTLQEYVRLLTGEVGLRLPRHQYAAFQRPSGRPVFYIIQDQVLPEGIGHRAIHHLAPEGVRGLVLRVMRALAKVWEFNRRQDRVRVAIDGQISNWSTEPAWPGASPPRGSSAVAEEAEPLYLDTSTPLFRVEGAEQLDPELFLRSAPSFLVWILRILFLKDVVDRYYDFHRVAVDLAANFHKEQRPELIPMVVEVINGFFAGEAVHLGVDPISADEVRAYYREDALIWRLYLSMRKVDRFLRRGLGREYPYILPERVAR